MRFKKFYSIHEDMELKDLDGDFVKSALRLKAFTLKSQDLKTTKYKKEIQFVVRTTWFPNFDLSQTIKGQPNLRKLNSLIDQLKRESMRNYNRLHFYNLKGVGPGEATLYFLMDDADLGGGGSAGVDLVVAGSKYEIKACLVSRDGSLSGFKLGGTAPVGPLVSKLVEFKEQLGLSTSGKGQNEVNGSQMAAIQKKFPSEYAKIEADYGRIAGRYFGRTPVIFINNNASDKVDPEDTAEKTRLLSSNAGGIVAIKKVTPRNIKMQVATQGTLKPKIKF